MTDIRMLNLKQFNNQIQKHVKKFNNKQLVNFIRGIALKMFTGFVRRTPVDTGLARNNWKMTRGSFGGGSMNKAWGSVDQIVARGMSVVRSYSKLQDLSQIIYIWNATSSPQGFPYIILLEQGHSKQAASGMMRVTFAEIVSNLNSKFNFTGYYEANGVGA